MGWNAWNGLREGRPRSPPSAERVMALTATSLLRNRRPCPCPPPARRPQRSVDQGVSLNPASTGAPPGPQVIRVTEALAR